MLRVPLRSTHPLIHVANVAVNTFLEILWAGHVLRANVRGVLSGRCTVSAGLDGFEVFGAGDPDFLRPESSVERLQHEVTSKLFFNLGSGPQGESLGV